VGVEGGSDCVAASRERCFLCLAFGSEAAPLTTSDLDLERVARLDLGLAVTFASEFAADIAVTGSEAASIFGLRPRPSCFANAERPAAPERRYALREVKQRLHQTSFSVNPIWRNALALFTRRRN
jgi:hypothetical protein